MKKLLNLLLIFSLSCTNTMNLINCKNIVNNKPRLSPSKQKENNNNCKKIDNIIINKNIDYFPVEINYVDDWMTSKVKYNFESDNKQEVNDNLKTISAAAIHKINEYNRGINLSINDVYLNFIDADKLYFIIKCKKNSKKYYGETKIYFKNMIYQSPLERLISNSFLGDIFVNDIKNPTKEILDKINKLNNINLTTKDIEIKNINNKVATVKYLNKNHDWIIKSKQIFYTLKKSISSLSSKSIDLVKFTPINLYKKDIIN